MKIERRTRESVEIIQLQGTMDIESFPRLKMVLAEIQAENATRVIVNLAGVSIISSSVVGALMNFEGELKRAGGSLILTELSKNCLYTLELLRLTDHFRIVNTMEEAIKAIHA
ncbi:MAG: STAS domain-containing protein [Leptospiraceae bacterium]|nr:STAS domain-containing protein [Leptospiraceae bacterium]